MEILRRKEFFGNQTEANFIFFFLVELYTSKRIPYKKLSTYVYMLENHYYQGNKFFGKVEKHKHMCSILW